MLSQAIYLEQNSCLTKKNNYEEIKLSSTYAPFFPNTADLTRIVRPCGSRCFCFHLIIRVNSPLIGLKLPQIFVCIVARLYWCRNYYSWTGPKFDAWFIPSHCFWVILVFFPHFLDKHRFQLLRMRTFFKLFTWFNVVRNVLKRSAAAESNFHARKVALLFIV